MSISDDAAFHNRFPEQVGHIGTHYPDCYKEHPACAWRVGYDDGRTAADREHREHIGAWDDAAENLVAENARLVRERDDTAERVGLAVAAREKAERERDEARRVAATLGELLHKAEQESDDA